MAAGVNAMKTAGSLAAGVTSKTMKAVTLGQVDLKMGSLALGGDWETNPDKCKKFLRAGVNDISRGIVWKKVTGATQLLNDRPGMYDSILEDVFKGEVPQKIPETDVPMFGGNMNLKEHLLTHTQLVALNRLMIIISNRYPNIGLARAHARTSARMHARMHARAQVRADAPRSGCDRPAVRAQARSRARYGGARRCRCTQVRVGGGDVRHRPLHARALAVRPALPHHHADARESVCGQLPRRAPEAQPRDREALRKARVRSSGIRGTNA